MDDRRTEPEAMQGSATTVEVAKAVLAVLEGDGGGPAALATVIGRSGSAPQSLAAKLLVRSDGSAVGTVGGGAIEAHVLETCRTVLRRGRSTRVHADLVRDLGMCCGGSMEVFVEYVQQQPRLFVIGAGHIAQAFVPMAKAAGFRATVFDDRQEFLSHPAFEGVRAESYDVDELVEAIGEPSRGDYFLIVTRDHARDEKALSILMRRPHRFVGMIGSRRKVHAVVGRIANRERGLGRQMPDFSRIHAPVGLALGGRTPPEIAVSILAEMVAARHGGGGGSMDITGDAAAQLLASTSQKTTV